MIALTKVVVLTLLLLPLASHSRVEIPAVQPKFVNFSNESTDWGVKVARKLKLNNAHSPTPIRIPNARVIRTLDLNKLLDTNDRVVLIDVLGNESGSIPGAIIMRGGGNYSEWSIKEKKEFPDIVKSHTDYYSYVFEIALNQLLQGDVNRPLVFFCSSAECWLSYNAALRAVEFGYQDVIWYRSGLQSWQSASFPLTKDNSSYDLGAK